MVSVTARLNDRPRSDVTRPCLALYLTALWRADQIQAKGASGQTGTGQC
jgi:hypothetical protein